MNTENKLKQNIGFSLIEAVIAISLLAIVALASMTYISTIGKQRQNLSGFTGRNSVSDKIRQLASSPAVVYWSAIANGADNLMLKNCVLGNTGTNCDANVANWHDVELYIPTSLVKGSGSFGGTPIFYHEKSFEPCTGVTAASRDCPFEVRTRFRAICPSTGFGATPTSCKLAESIEVDYQVTHAWPATHKNQVQYKTVRSTVTIDNRDISMFKLQDFSSSGTGTNLGCPPGEVSVGYSGTGELICQKLANICPNGTIAAGIDKFGRWVATYTGGESLGVFVNNMGVAEIQCIPTKCNTGVMTGMVSGATGSLYNTLCTDADMMCTLNDAQVVIDILGDGLDANLVGDPMCGTLNVCKNPNVAGNDKSQTNYTVGFSSYNTTVSKTPPYTGGVNATCEVWGCGLQEYMSTWLPNGNCSQGASCSPSPWSPAPSTICNGVTFTQTDGCGGTRSDTGTRVPTDWAPSPATICSGTAFTQTNSCGQTQSATGTQALVWSPDPADVCAGEIFTQTTSCSPIQTRSATGTKAGCGPVGTDCVILHPYGWSTAPVGGYHCAEFYAVGPGGSTVIPDGDTYNGNFTFCVGEGPGGTFTSGACHGGFTATCNAGSLTWADHTCTWGPEP